MIPRYTRPVMQELFNDDARFGIWLEVELAHLQTLENHGIAPSGVTERCASRAEFSIDRIDDRLFDGKTGNVRKRTG